MADAGLGTANPLSTSAAMTAVVPFSLRRMPTLPLPLAG